MKRAGYTSGMIIPSHLNKQSSKRKQEVRPAPPFVHPLTKVKITKTNPHLGRKALSSGVSERSGSSASLKSETASEQYCGFKDISITGKDLLKRERSLEKIHTFDLK
jgi:hypothetical protein